MARFFFLMGLLFSVSGHPQSKIDSLKNRLGLEKVDSLKVNLLLDLFDEYQYEDPAKAENSVQKALDIATGIRDKRYEVMALNAFADLLNGRAQNDSAISVFQKALALAEDITYDSGKGMALLGLGNTYLSKGDLIQAEAYHRRNIDFAKEVDDFEGLASSHNNLGNIYNEKGEYKKAMEAYTYAAKINTEIGNEKNAGINFANIGLINQKLSNYHKALDYYAKSDSLFKKFDFLPGRAFVLKNMGVVYRNQEKPDEALKKYHQALESYKQMDLKREMSQVYENIGNIYSDRSQSIEAIYNYHRSLSIATQTSDSINMAIFNQSLGQEFFYAKKWDSAVYYSRRALEMAKEVGADLTAMDGYKVLAEVYRAKSEHEKAYAALEEYQAMRDSLYTIEKRDLAEEIEAQYQNEEKTKEIALLASEKEVQALQLSKRKNERNGTIAFSVFILLLAVLLYNQYRIKQKANKELQELGRLKSNFFANISHEFRTPLTLIKGPIEHLEQNPEEQLDRNDVKMIRRNTNKVLGLVNQLLDLSRIDEGKLQLKSTEGDIFKCLRTAAASFNSYAAQRHMDYRLEIPSETLWAAFDRDKLEKVVYNLLSNAFKFSEDGELVALEASYAKAELVIQVSDSGQGISEDKLPYIFDRFYQVDGGITKEREGSGIGLSLSKDLVELMDGTITVSSEKGKGTYFTVQIPIAKIKTPRASVEAEIPKETKEAPQQETFNLPKTDERDLPHILLVEDNDDMLQFIKARLLETYRITEARNGEEGFKMAQAHVPDLLITDLMMPKMDGMELCKKLKTNLETSHIPVIMLTARAGVENKIEGLETGADDYLTKPFNAKELLVRVKNLIDQRQRLREHYRNNALTIHPEKITTTSLDRKFLEQVMDLLERKYADASFGVPQMQRALAMSKTQLHRKIKALTNESPGELLRNFRLKRAAQLLSQKADTVTQIAYQVGFNNLSYFAKCFKALYGVAPSSY